MASISGQRDTSKVRRARSPSSFLRRTSYTTARQWCKAKSHRRRDYITAYSLYSKQEAEKEALAYRCKGRWILWSPQKYDWKEATSTWSTTGKINKEAWIDRYLEGTTIWDCFESGKLDTSWIANSYLLGQSFDYCICKTRTTKYLLVYRWTVSPRLH